MSCLSDSSNRRAVSDSQAMDSIHAILDGEEWSSDHLDAIAEVLVSTGRTIRSCDDDEEE